MKGKAILLSSDSYAVLHLIMTRFQPELRGIRFDQVGFQHKTANVKSTTRGSVSASISRTLSPLT